MKRPRTGGGNAPADQVGMQIDRVRELQREHTRAWRRVRRADALQLIAQRTHAFKWSPALLSALVEELYVEEELARLVGEPGTLAVRHYPQAVAIALMLRHSWRRDDLCNAARRLGISTRGL